MEQETPIDFGIEAFSGMSRSDLRERNRRLESSTVNDQLALYLAERSDIDHIVQLSALLEDNYDREPPRAVVAIPVAGHQEAENIDRALSQYDKQLLDKKLWEMVLFVNSPKQDALGNQLSNQQTIQEIETAKTKYNLHNLRTIDHQYDKPVPIGKIRGDLWNTVLADLYVRDANQETLIINNDIDTVALRPDYVTNMVYSHFINQHKIINGPLRYDSPKASPIANKLIRYDWNMYHANNKKTSRGGHIIVEANTAIDAGLYCTLGGFKPQRTIGEMIELQERIDSFVQERIHIRGAFPGWNQNALVRTSSRRQLGIIAAGKSLRDTWNTDEMPFTSFDSLRSDPPHQAAEAVARQRFAEYIAQTDEDFVIGSHLSDKVRKRMIPFAAEAKRIMGIRLGNLAVDKMDRAA